MIESIYKYRNIYEVYSINIYIIDITNIDIYLNYY